MLKFVAVLGLILLAVLVPLVAIAVEFRDFAAPVATTHVAESAVAHPRDAALLALAFLRAPPSR